MQRRYRYYSARSRLPQIRDIRQAVFVGADTASEPKSVRHLQGPFRTLTHDLPDALVKPGFRFRFADVERTWTRTGIPKEADR